MTLKCHSYKENSNTRFSFKFGKYFKYYILKHNNHFSMENISIRNSRPKVPFINYSSRNYGKLLEKYWQCPLFTKTSLKNGLCLEHFNISFNISAKECISRLYLLNIIDFFSSVSWKSGFRDCPEKENTKAEFTRPWWCFSKVPALLARTRSLMLSYKALDMS